MRISLPRYNTKSQFELLQVFMFMLDERYINYEAYYDLTGKSYRYYGETMTRLEKMLPALSMNVRLLKKYKYAENVNRYRPVYALAYIDSPYLFTTYNATKEELIIYSPVIIYCLLKRNQYVTTSRLAQILPYFNRKKFCYIRASLDELLSIKLIKNKTQSYEIAEEE